MTTAWLEGAVRECQLPLKPSINDFKENVGKRLRVRLLPVWELTSGYVGQWLGNRGLSFKALPTKSRRLHGCMVALSGRGFVFYDSSDNERQQRFTLAHEVAHFVVDHRMLRAEALRTFGESIRPVLDLDRDPTVEESLSSLFQRVPFGIQVRLMDRDDSGSPSNGEAMETELRADLLAFELLAPAREALPFIQHMSERQAESALAFRFGLPPKEAKTYAHLLRMRLPNPRPFFLEGLIEEKPENG